FEHADASRLALVGGSQGDAAAVRIPGQGGQGLESRWRDPRGFVLQVPHAGARTGTGREVLAAGVEGELVSQRGWPETGDQGEGFGGPVAVADSVVALALRVALRLPHGAREPQRRRGRVVPLARHQPEGREAIG